MDKKIRKILLAKRKLKNGKSKLELMPVIISPDDDFDEAIALAVYTRIGEEVEKEDVTWLGTSDYPTDLRIHTFLVQLEHEVNVTGMEWIRVSDILMTGVCDTRFLSGGHIMHYVNLAQMEAKGIRHPMIAGWEF
jgi:hypothetical protein